MQINLTAKCNHRCIHCYLSGNKNKTETALSTTKIISLLKEAKDLGIIQICFSGGEILSLKDFIKLYTKAKKMGFCISLKTNLSLLNTAHLSVFEKYPPAEVRVTFFADNEVIFDKCTRIKGSYQRVIKNLLKLKKILPSQQIALVAPRMTINKDYLVSVKELAIKQGFSQGEIDYIFEDKMKLGISALNLESNPSFFKKILPFQGKKKAYTCGTICLDTNISWFISNEGYLYICPILEKYKFSLKKYSLEKCIVQALQVRKQLKAALAPVKCQKCNYASFCSWCPARAYVLTGDEKSAPDHFCRLAGRIQ